MLTLELAGCRLRPWRRDDALSLQRHADDLAVWANLRDRFPHPYSLQDARAWIELTAAGLPGVHLAIDVDGEAAGGISLEPQADVERIAAEVGFWLGRTHWGRGVMTQVVRALSDWALNHGGWLRLYASVFETNPASMRVLEKAAFHREGVLRKSAIKDARVLDRVLYARVRDD
jgi:RimJ/RimL family protein N-acetyltransferase